MGSAGEMSGAGEADGDQQDPGTLAPARTSEPAADQSEPDRDAPVAGKSKKRKSFGRELLTIVVAAAVLTLLVKAFIVQVYRIPSASMENTLQVGDRVLVEIADGHGVVNRFLVGANLLPI